jgi:hypothetical protein
MRAGFSKAGASGFSRRATRLLRSELEFHEKFFRVRRVRAIFRAEIFAARVLH